MARVFTPEQYFTRTQSDVRYLPKPAPPSVPTGLVLDATGIIVSPTEQYAFLRFVLDPPPADEALSGYEFEHTHPSSGAMRTQFVVFGSDLQIDGLDENTNYSVRVRAVDFYGQTSVYTVSANFLTAVDNVAPVAPSILVSPLARGALIKISSLNIEPDFNRYELERGQQPDGSDFSIVARFQGDTFVDGAIPVAGSYFYRVRAVDFSGNISQSAIEGPVSLQDTDEQPPSVPNIANGSITVNSDGSLTIDWPGNTDANLAFYRVWRKRSSQMVWSIVATITAVPNDPASYTDLSVLHGISYDYSVSAINGVGDDSAFDTINVLTATANDSDVPDAPTALAYIGGSGRVQVSWLPSASNDVQFYEISYRLRQVDPFGAIILVVGTSFTLFGLTDLREDLANQLEFRVRARDEVGNFSSYLQAVASFPDLSGYHPADNSIPSAPIFVTGTPRDDGSVLLSWSAPNIPDLWGFRIDRFDSDLGDWEVLATLQDSSPGTKSYVDAGLEPFAHSGREYRYAIRSIDNSGNISSFNVIENSSFESGLSGWTTSGGVANVVATPVRSGSQALQANGTASPQQTHPVVVGKRYVFSAYAQEDSAPGATASVRISWRDGINQEISAVTGSVVTQNSYLRASASGVAPAGAVSASLILVGESGVPATTFFWEDVQFEQSVEVTSYADGKTGLLRAVDTTGPSQSEGALALTATPKLGAILLVWNNGTSKDFINAFYEIWRSISSGGIYSKVGEVPANNDGLPNVFEDLDPDENTPTTYFYKLKARDRFANISGFLNSTPATTTSFTPNDVQIITEDTTPPVEPTLGTATANSDGSILFTWSPNSEPDLQGYIVWMRPQGGTFRAVSAVPSSANAYTAHNLVLGLTYEFTVSAFDFQGNESTKNISTPASATAIDTRVAAAPTQPLMTGGIGRIDCAWTASAFLGVERYEFEYSVNNGSSWSTTEVIAGTSRTVFGLSQTSSFLQANFKFRTRAIGRGGTVGNYLVSGNPVAADMVNYRPSDGSAPAAVAGFAATPQDNGDVVLTWNANSESDLFAYRVERQYNGGGYEWIADIAAASPRSYRDVGLEPFNFRNRAYDYRIFAIDNSGSISTASTITDVHVRDTSAPSQSEGSLALTAAGKIGAIDLSWTNGSGFDFIDSVYEIWRSTTGSGGVYSKIGEQLGADGGPNGWEDTEPDDQTAVAWHYKLKVRDRWSNLSGFINATPATATSKTSVLIDTIAPAVPTGLAQDTNGIETAPDGTKTAFVQLRWNQNSETDLDHYELQHYLISATGNISLTSVPLNHSGGLQKHTIRGLTPGGQYGFKVLAADKQNNKSAFTSQLQLTMPAVTAAPATPTITVRSLFRGNVVIISSPNTENDFLRYDLYRNTTNNSGTATKIAEFAARGFVDESATPGDTYWYWVKAVNRSGVASAFSNGVSVVTRFIVDTDGPRLGLGRTPTTYLMEVAGDMQLISGAATGLRVNNTGVGGRAYSLRSL